MEFGFLGVTFGKLGCGPGLGGPAGSIVNVAPVLTWITPSSDNTPDFTADLTAPIVGDTITLEWDDNSDFSSPISTAANVVDAGEALGLQVSFTVGALADGVYYFHAKHNSSAWSNSVTVTINTAVAGGSFYQLLFAA